MGTVLLLPLVLRLLLRLRLLPLLLWLLRGGYRFGSQARSPAELDVFVSEGVSVGYRFYGTTTCYLTSASALLLVYMYYINMNHINIKIHSIDDHHDHHDHHDDDDQSCGYRLGGIGFEETPYRFGGYRFPKYIMISKWYTTNYIQIMTYKSYSTSCSWSCDCSRCCSGS